MTHKQIITEIEKEFDSIKTAYSVSGMKHYMMPKIEKLLLSVLEKQEKEIAQKIYDFVEAESGKSGRKEIKDFIKDNFKVEKV